jgi:hypothetical protein
MNHDTPTTRPTGHGAPLGPETVQIVRTCISGGLLRRLTEVTGLSRQAIERAGAGAAVMKGTSALLEIGISRLRESGELPRGEASSLG